MDRGDGMITSAVVSRAGAVVAPSEPPAHLVVQRTVLASEPSTVGRANHASRIGTRPKCPISAYMASWDRRIA
jgi:hypothetical protein